VKLTLERLGADLAERLRPVYLVSGDEPLRVGEALDAIREAARARGFAERQVFFVERQGAIWDEVQQAAQARSLFAARRSVEIRLPSGKPGASGATALRRLAQVAGDELLVLIVTGQLERDAVSAPWVQEVQERGAWIPIWPLERARLPQWLRARFAAAGLSASDAAVTLLTERSEGNLLAARQEIDKLALLLPRGARAELADVVASSCDSARFDVFQLADAVRAGEGARALRILESLRAEGGELVLVLWALLRELRGGRVPPRARLGLPRLLRRAARADRMTKGLLNGDPWDEVAVLAAELSGGVKLPLVPPAMPPARP
jgi:DNA polymerase III subunit delta